MAVLFFDPHIFQTIDPGAFTVNDLITSALKLIGAISGIETPSPDEQMDALARLNDMLDAWAANSMAIFQIIRTEWPLTYGKQVYAIGQGPGADFQAFRPIWIQRAGIVETASQPEFELPIKLLNADEWAQITIKGTAATLSWYLWDDFAYPNSNLSLWPKPISGTLKLALYVPTPVSRFTSAAVPLGFPPGWSEALRYNLAVRLCPEWGRPLDPVVANIAQESFATLQRANTRPSYLGIDSALIGPERSIYNWLTDRPGPW